MQRHFSIRRLTKNLDASGLAGFRIVFGIVLAIYSIYEVASAQAVYSFSNVYPRFPYDGFSWLAPLSPTGIQALYSILVLAAVMTSLGWYYRFFMSLVFLILTYTFLLDKSNYLNHHYLLCTFTGLMVMVPAHAACSVDHYLKTKRFAGTVPAWSVWLLRTQLGIVFLFAGLAKMNTDWLVQAEPMRRWLSEFASSWGWQALLHPSVPYVFAWGGMLFDLLIAPCLVWRRTRGTATVLAIGFHLSNAILFNIGIFPWFMIASLLLFYGAEPKPLPYAVPTRHRPTRKWAYGYALGCLYLVLQLWLPVRHLAIPGDVNWTKEGSRYAWRMKLNGRPGKVVLLATSDRWVVPQAIDLQPLLSPRLLDRLHVWPDLTHDVARYAKSQLEAEGHQRVAIFAKSRVALNGRQPAPLFKPSVDLTQIAPRAWLASQSYFATKEPPPARQTSASH